MTNHKTTKVVNSLLLAAITVLAPDLAFAQYNYAPFTTPDAQRNALNALRSQIDVFQNTTRTAQNYGEQGYGNVAGQFQGLRDAFNGFKSTLTPQQLGNGANALAELDAGLDIIGEAFTNFQNDVAGGRSPSLALRDMCQVLRQGTQVWWQQLNKIRGQLRIGWG